MSVFLYPKSDAKEVPGWASFLCLNGGRKKNNKTKAWIIISVVVVLIVCAVVIIAALFGQRVSENKEADGDGTESGLDRTGSVEVIEKSGASYERWLAAGMVTAVSMQNPDFEIEGIYLTGETDPADKMQSGGAYVIFTADGTETAVQSTPLEAERTDAGTTDLYTRDLGFAAFDVIDPAQIDTEACVAVSMDELEELISQSLLVSLYEH